MGSHQVPKNARWEHRSDHRLVALAGRGDREAFAELYDIYGGAAYSLAFRIAGDREMAADAVQNAFLAVWNQARQFDPSRGEPLTWILTLTHHHAVDMVRREERRPAEPLAVTTGAPDAVAGIDRQAEPAVAHDQIRAALAKLADPYRELIELAYFGGYTQSELADRLAVPIATVKSRTFAAMNALRDTLLAMGIHPKDE